MSAQHDQDPAASVLAFFGSELRRLRLAANLSQEELGNRISYSGAQVGAVEVGRRVPGREFTERCDEALGTDGILARLWPLASSGALPHWFRPFAEIERDATSIRTWEPMMVPGLLQTEDYARALITGRQPGETAETVERQVSTRLERQGLLGRADPPLYWAIIGEAALRNPVGGSAVLREQLARLLDIDSEHPRIILQIIPLTAGAHPGLEGPLVLATRPREPDIAYLEVQGRAHIVYRANEVARYGLLYDMLRAMALSPSASRDMLADCAKGIMP